MKPKYYATNCFSYGCGDTPWEALSNLQWLDYNGNEPRRISPEFTEKTKDISLWIILDGENSFDCTQCGPYRNDKICGVLLYATNWSEIHEDALHAAWGEYERVLFPEKEKSYTDIHVVRRIYPNDSDPAVFHYQSLEGAKKKIHLLERSYQGELTKYDRGHYTVWVNANNDPVIKYSIDQLHD